MELADNFKNSGALSQQFVVVNGVEYCGWVAARPINPRWWRTRIRDAWRILRGNAIAIQYFEDLNQKQKEEYIKKYWQEARFIDNPKKNG